ncbi:hypothetical protein NG796_07795 [Laspinema sp. A4]|uniref:hypothetical protein n=1 Tax=Laspinema sp. D2d TaxID=2953686 RepID=UPI0021BA3EEF|nr:hypothetical protein [Laspinema sp. D2d]MCT7983193.1 hypothetical protein [Laspinema sp. D2d]
MKLLKCLSAVVASLVLVSGPSWAVPATNADGDYLFPGRRGNRQFNWQVSDRDPNGLNCRMPRQFLGIVMDSMEVPETLRTNNRNEISQWSVVRVFEGGDRLEAVTGNLANQIVLLDKRGKPWIPVSIEEGNCFVRANSRFIVPIPEDPVTLEPLE